MVPPYLAHGLHALDVPWNRPRVAGIFGILGDKRPDGGNVLTGDVLLPRLGDS
jgi:hypothetical protein